MAVNSPGVNPVGVPKLAGGSFIVSNIPIGPVALASIGTNTTGVIQLWLSELFVPCNRFVTKIGLLQGGTAGTDKALGVIYDSSGALVGSSALAGTNLNGSANTFLEVSIALDGSGAAVGGVQLFGPGQYYVGYQLNGTAVGDVQTLNNPYLMAGGAVAAGVFGTLPATITPPSAFSANNVPVIYIK